MAARPRRDPAAERRIFETLRKMAQRQAVRLQLALQRRPKRAALDPRGARGRVDLQDLAEMAQVEGDGRLAPPSARCSTPPQTLEPPPNGASEAPTPPAQSITAEISASLRG